MLEHAFVERSIQLCFPGLKSCDRAEHGYHGHNHGHSQRFFRQPGWNEIEGTAESIRCCDSRVHCRKTVLQLTHGVNLAQESLAGQVN